MRSSSLLASVSLVSLALLAGTLSGCGGEIQIVHGLDEFEANEVLVVLEAKGITGRKEKEEGRVVTYAVAVSDVEQKDAMRILVANHLPRQRPSTFEKVYPAGGGGLIPTKSEEKAKYMMALQGEVEKKLLILPGIVEAHVSIVSPDKDIVRNLDTPGPPATASVAIVYNAIDERGTAAVAPDEVKSLVASSVEGLLPAQVTVVMKKNVPANLVEKAAESTTVDAPVSKAIVFGIKLADSASAKKLQLYAIVFGVVAVLGIAVGVGGIFRSLSLSRTAAKAQAELTSMRKATRGTSTGMQQQPPG